MVDRAFTNHRINGVSLTFPNGNRLSTIWGRGSYTENHDFTTGDVIKDFSEPIKEGSNTVEIMITHAPDKLVKKIHRKLAPNSEDSVIGWLSMTDWLWVVNQLARGTK